MINLEIKYGPLERPEELERAGHPEGTLVRRFNVESRSPDGDCSIGVGIYFHPDGRKYFLILEDGIADRMFAYTDRAMALFMGFMDWLSRNKEKVYPPVNGEGHV